MQHSTPEIAAGVSILNKKTTGNKHNRHEETDHLLEKVKSKLGGNVNEKTGGKKGVRLEVFSVEMLGMLQG